MQAQAVLQDRVGQLRRRVRLLVTARWIFIALIAASLLCSLLVLLDRLETISVPPERLATVLAASFFLPTPATETADAGFWSFYTADPLAIFFKRFALVTTILVLAMMIDYAPLVREIIKFFQTGVAPVSAEETLEIFAFMEAADESKRQGGQPISLSDVMKKNGGQ